MSLFGKISGLPVWARDFIVAFAAGVLAMVVADAILRDFRLGLVIGIFVVVLVLAIVYLLLPKRLRVRGQHVLVEIASDGTLISAKWETTLENRGGLVEKRLHSLHSLRASLANVNITARDREGDLPPVLIRTQHPHGLDFYVYFRKPLVRGSTYSYSRSVSNIKGFFDLAGPCSWRYAPYEPVDQFDLEVHHPPRLKVASATMTEITAEQPIAAPQTTYDGRRETTTVRLQNLSPLGRYLLEWQYAKTTS